jgi:hypothetical protein
MTIATKAKFAVVLVLAAGGIAVYQWQVRAEAERYRMLLAGTARITRLKITGQMKQFDITEPTVLRDFERAFAARSNLHPGSGAITYECKIFVGGRGAIETCFYVYEDHHGLQLADQSRMGAGDPAYVQCDFPRDLSPETAKLVDALAGKLLVDEEAGAAAPPDKPLSDALVGPLEKLLDEISPWPAVSDGYPRRSWSRLVSAARIVQTNEPEAVARALRKQQLAGKPIAEFKYAGLKRTLDDSKLFLLMRVVFEIPDSAPSSVESTPGFGNWTKPATPENPAWPIRWNNGKPEFVSPYRGVDNNRERYDAAKEYRYFQKTCRPRDLSAFRE